MARHRSASDRETEARLAAALASLKAHAWEVVADHYAAGVEPPRRVLVFVNRRSAEAAHGNRGGARATVWPTVREWFRGRDNRPATAQEIAEGTGLMREQVDRLTGINASRLRFERRKRAGEPGRVYEYSVLAQWLGDTPSSEPN